MQTMRKHFPVSWLTSGRLDFVNQSEAESTNLKNGGHRRGNFACEKEGTPHHTKWFRLSKENICRTTAVEYSYFINTNCYIANEAVKRGLDNPAHLTDANQPPTELL